MRTDALDLMHTLTTHWKGGIGQRLQRDSEGCWHDWPLDTVISILEGGELLDGAWWCMMMHGSVHGDAERLGDTWARPQRRAAG